MVGMDSFLLISVNQSLHVHLYVLTSHRLLMADNFIILAPHVGW